MDLLERLNMKATKAELVSGLKPQVSEDEAHRGPPWYHKFDDLERAKIHLVRAFIMNPEVLVLHRPFYASGGRRSIFSDLLLECLREHVENRGLCMPRESAHTRRLRTCFFTPESPSQANVADIIITLTEKGQAFSRASHEQEAVIEDEASEIGSEGERESDDRQVGGVVKAFRIDQMGLLQDGILAVLSPGLQYYTRMHEDPGAEADGFAMWQTVVQGSLSDDGRWLKIGERKYLRTDVRGVPVLKEIEAPMCTRGPAPPAARRR